MFEEIVIWSRSNSADVAIRYTGFRDLSSGRVWFAFANFVAAEDEEGRRVPVSEVVCPDETVDRFLQGLPTDPDCWKATMSDALADFQTKDRFD